ncbi:MAG: tetraacyldisaccharide 4'-kinase [Gammaproteobacteria bacterium]|nr:tetraacyldisaccharide 4'-kinase [Gammaproteobacteria bacterium]
MQAKLTAWIERSWYGSRPFWPMLLLQPLYVAVTAFRRWAYATKLFSAWKAPVPVLVVGNISIGGTGKTPLTIALVEEAQTMGLRVGVVSRGYGRDNELTRVLKADDSATVVGDEPLLIFQRTSAPAAVASKRSDAAKALLAEQQLDLLIADDGLQHYALARDAEVVVVDSQRGFGNGWQLPSGPLREPQQRLNKADAVVINQRGGQHEQFSHELALSTPMTLAPGELVNVVTGERLSLGSFKDQSVIAIAGIGNPQVFYDGLAKLGMNVEPLYFQDHHVFTDRDLPGLEKTIVMTEKDAVKLAPIAKAKQHHNCWYIPVTATLNEGFAEALIRKTLDSYKAQSS